MVVVADSSPLIALVGIGRGELLPQLFGELVIPPAVAAELRSPKRSEAVRSFMAARPVWLLERAPAAIEAIPSLHAGEREAISLASELKADLLIIDEMRGRQVATSRQVPFIGTIGVLEAAANKGLVERTVLQHDQNENHSMKIAAVQMDVALGNRQANLAAVEARLREAARNGAQLVVFPECALPGYCFDSLDEARGHAEPVPGPATGRLAESCRELSVHAVVGLLEAREERLFNTAALIGPAGVAGVYRKVHLPYLGVDRFTTPGDCGFAVHAAGQARIGMSICYDAAFPEAARVLALEGADLIALPTNWPPGAECTADYLINARALENNVYFMAVDRVGTERGFEFIGQSKICDPRGQTLAEARHTDETILYADIDLAFARRKHVVRVPGKHEIDRFADRRPETYGRIVERLTTDRPGR